MKNVINIAPQLQRQRRVLLARRAAVYVVWLVAFSLFAGMIVHGLKYDSNIKDLGDVVPKTAPSSTK